MRSDTFFETHPVFTLQEFHAARAGKGAKLNTSKNLLAKYVASGRLMRVKRGVYAVVPRGVDPDKASVDPYLLASRLSPDAVVSYHAALQFFGKSYSIWNRYHYLTLSRRRPTGAQGYEFLPVLDPAPLRGREGRGGGITEVPHAGGWVRVTVLERAAVDVLYDPERAGGWEEIWRSLEMIEFFDLDVVVAHTIALGSALTAARVGFFLQQHMDALMVESDHIEILRRYAPREPRYLDARRTPGRLAKPWNLVVPQYLLERGWEDEG